MHLTEGEFWRLTPRQFAKLMERLAANWEREWMGYACLRSDIANACGAKSSPSDFMPGKGGPKKLTGDETVAFLKSMGAQVG